ncbi:MAG: alpha/beta fold hydrolase [Hyphomonadaceae bacterium]
MQRRDFVRGAMGVLAANTAGGCAIAGDQEAGGGAHPMDARAFHAARRFHDSAFGRVAVLDRGVGPAALFLHGFPLSGFQWRGAIDRLQAHRRCIAPDLLGLGFTDVTPGQSVAPNAQVEMLVELLDALQIRDADIIANDSGGAVAQLLAIRHPERVRTVLFTNCDVEPDSPPAALIPVIELARAGRFADEWIVPWVGDHALAQSAQGLGGLCYADPRNPTDEMIECYLEPLVGSATRKAWTNAYAVALDPNPLAGIEAQLRQCRAPARILWGAADNIFSADSPFYLDRILPNSRGVRRIEGAKLFWPEEQPDIIAEEALALWA